MEAYRLLQSNILAGNLTIFECLPEPDAIC